MSVDKIFARVSLTLEIPASVAQEWLSGTDYEGVALGDEPDQHDREAIGEWLDVRVVEDFPFLLHYAHSDPDVECDW